MPKAPTEPEDEASFLYAYLGLASGHWPYRTAKAHFSELFQRALEAPQLVRRSEEGVILIQSDHFCRLVARSYAPAELVELFHESVLDGINYEISVRPLTNA